MSVITNFKLFESNDEFLNQIKNNEVYKEISTEFDIEVYLKNNELTLNSKSKDITVVINTNTNKIVVWLGSKVMRTSTFFKLNNETDTLETGVGIDQIEIMLSMSALNIMDAVWVYNYDNYFSPKNIFKELSYETLNTIVQDTGLTVNDIEDTHFKDAANKYHLMKNLLDEEPYHVLYLKYLPNSLEEDEETRQALQDLVDIGPGVLF